MNALKNKLMTVGVASAALAALSGTASGQLSSEYASGLLHSAVGDADLGPVAARRLPVHNLGSSGQDGVEVKFNSMWGGGAGVSAPGLFGSGGGGGGAGGMLHTKHKKWDGTPGGSMIVSSGPGGMMLTCDFSDLSATAVRVMQYQGGQLVSDVTTVGPVCNGPIVPECPPPQVPTIWYWKLWNSNTQQYVYQWMWTCQDHVTLNGQHLQDEMRIIPELPVGLPDDEGPGTMMITSDGPDIEILDAQLLTFGTSNYGTGGAHIEEECDGGVPCAQASRRIRATNIGSSGQDGVSVTLGPGSAGGSISYGRSVNGWDLKENVKAFDDQGTQMMRVGNAPSPTSGQNSALEFDFSGVGDGSFEAVFYDGDHNPIGTAFYIPNVGGTVVLDPSWMCMPPTYPVYGYNYNTNTWHFLCCAGGFDLVLPSGETIGPVMSMEMTPASPARHRLRSFEVAGSSICEDVVIQGVTEVGCAAEVTGDGIIDLTDFFQFLNDFDTSQPGADIDGIPGVDLGDFFTFLNSFDQGC